MQRTQIYFEENLLEDSKKKNLHTSIGATE